MAGEADGEQDTSATISQVLDGYLQTERARLASRTYARDAEVIGLLKKSLTTDGVNDLIPEELEQFRSHGVDFERGDPPYCDALGPYYLMLHLPTFLTTVTAWAPSCHCVTVSKLPWPSAGFFATCSRVALNVSMSSDLHVPAIFPSLRIVQLVGCTWSHRGFMQAAFTDV